MYVQRGEGERQEWETRQGEERERERERERDQLTLSPPQVRPYYPPRGQQSLHYWISLVSQPPPHPHFVASKLSFVV